jgi:arabinogalactan endo-1,4-beta-galactosidase
VHAASGNSGNSGPHDLPSRREALFALAGIAAVGAVGGFPFGARGEQPASPGKFARPAWRLAGADMSFLPQYEAAGVQFFAGPGQTQPTDALAIMARRGVNLLRLRVWNDPVSGWCSVPRTLAMAARARQLGMRTLIDFHYSDTWADPGQQATPAAWAGLSAAALAQRVYDFTRGTLLALAAQGSPAYAVQIGNEITDGMLWPTGRVSAGGWTNLVSLLDAGLSACRSAGVGSPKTMIHIDRGGDQAGAQWFFGNLWQRGVRCDMLGLSYYPWWHGPLAALEANLHALAANFQREVFIAETAYPWSLAWQDNTHNSVGTSAQLLPGFAATPNGQAAFFERLGRIMDGVPGDLGAGVCAWAPEHVAAGDIGTPWENLTLFDFGRSVLPGAAALGASAQRG